jgi:arginine:ornithine antiporter/lysine permease
MTATESQPEQATGKVSLPTLTAMVVGSMIGSGVFLLPRRFGAETGVLGAIIAWTIAGTGMLMLAFVFQRLAMRKPQLDAGIFAYAKAGFGDYVGFNSAIGYWASACAGNTSYWVLITATMSAVVPAFGAGDTVARSERGLRVFRPAEAVLFGVILLGAVAGVVSLATGAIEI